MGLPGSEGRIQDIAEQELARLLMPQDGDGEPQVVDLWGGAAQGGQEETPGVRGPLGRAPTCRLRSGTMGEKRYSRSRDISNCLRQSCTS